MQRLVVILVALSASVVTSGCPLDDGLECIEFDSTCQPLYDPTFDNVFGNTLVPTCAPPGGACHAPEGNAGGIIYEDADSAYDILLGEQDGRARVVPFDADCSILVQRIESSDPDTVMPPGGRLSDAERCAIEQWIANGAER